MGTKKVLLVLLFSCMLQNIHALRRVNVEDLVADVKLRFADDFKSRTDDGNPPGLEDLLDLPKEEDLKKQSSVETVKNVVKTKFEQLYENIPVYGSHITAAKNEETGKSTEEVTGVVFKDIKEDVKGKKVKITGKKALKIAKKHHGHGDTAEETFKLYVYPKDKDGIWAYMVSYIAVNEKEQLTQPITVVDATTKKVLETWEGLSTAFKNLDGYGGNTHIGRLDFTGEANQFGKLNLTVDPNDASRCLMKNKYLRVVDLNGKNFRNNREISMFIRQAKRLPTIAVDCNTDPIPNKVLADANNVINEVYYFTTHTFQMYESFNLTAYNRPLDIWVNFTDVRGGNAAAFSDFIIVNNGGRTFYPLSSYPDVLAHELAHRFTGTNSKLEYRVQSGGMNEAFSDMSGVTFSNYLQLDHEWIIGKNVFRNHNKRGLRYMNNPPLDGKSIGNATLYNAATNVHYTSGVYNKAFFLLSTTNGWDINRAFEVFSLANTMYWGATSTFDEGACGVIDAARDRGYSTNDVIQAFTGVSVRCNRPNIP